MNKNADSTEVSEIKLVQKKPWNLAEFTFGMERLIYHAELGGVNITREVGYSTINVHAQEHRTNSNVYFRNVGAFFAAYGLILGTMNSSNFIFALIGLGFLGYFYVTKFGFSVYPAEGGNIVIFDGEEKDKILEEIKKRRAAILRKILSPLNYRNSKEQELAKYEFLKKEKAISEVEYDLYVSQVTSDAMKYLG